jgi:transposase
MSEMDHSRPGRAGNRSGHIRYAPKWKQLRSTCNSATSQRIATRYDKLAANYLAFVKLAAIRIC